MARFGGRHLGDGFYEEPDWWPDYLRVEAESGGSEGVDPRTMWAHVHEHWRDYVLPDLARFYPALPLDEVALEEVPWRGLRSMITSLFAIPDSLTGSTFARIHNQQEAS